MPYPHLRGFALKPLLSRRATTQRLGKQGFIAGTAQIEGAPTRRRVRCIERATGRLVAETWSTPQGAFRFDGLELKRRYQLLAMDYELQYNAVIADNVAPVPGEPDPIAPPEETLLSVINVAAALVSDVTTLSWRNLNLSQDEIRIYRSDAPMDATSLPAPITTLSAFETQYADATAPAATVLYYRVGVARDGTEVVSEETEFDPNAAGAPVGVALVDDTVQGGVFEWVDVEGNIIAQPAPAFFDNHPAFAFTEETIDGQVMIRVPKSYWRRAQITIPPYSGTKDCWWVSASPQPGFQLFNAFLLNGVEIEQFWIGKFEGSLSGGMLSSLPGVTPTASRSWTQFQIDAEARNVGGVEGFCMHHMDMRSVIQWLYLIEVGSFDSQEATARGNVDSGSTYATDHPDNLAASYRGIVALWGNLTEWIDGIRMDSAQIEYRDYGGGAWSVLGSPPTTGAHYPNSWDMSSTFADLFISSAFQSSESGALIPDYTYYRSSSTYIAHVGGARNSGGNAGLWYLVVSFTATDTTTIIGSRLARVV